MGRLWQCHRHCDHRARPADSCQDLLINRTRVAWTTGGLQVMLAVAVLLASSGLALAQTCSPDTVPLSGYMRIDVPAAVPPPLWSDDSTVNWLCQYVPGTTGNDFYLRSGFTVVKMNGTDRARELWRATLTSKYGV